MHRQVLIKQSYFKWDHRDCRTACARSCSRSFGTAASRLIAGCSVRTRLNNIEYYWIIVTDFRILGNFLICFRKFDWKSTDGTLFWNLARNPKTNSSKILRKNAKFDEKLKKSEIQLFNHEKMLTIFGWNFEIEERCKGVHCVDLGESFPTSVYLQKSASIQPRTSPSKFYSILTIILFNIFHSCP